MDELIHELGAPPDIDTLAATVNALSLKVELSEIRSQKLEAELRIKTEEIEHLKQELEQVVSALLIKQKLGNYLSKRMDDLEAHLLEQVQQVQSKLVFASPFATSKIMLPNDGGELELVTVPGGIFSMGSDRSPDEQPIHLVTVRGFRMGRYPITQKQYQAVIGSNPSQFKQDNAPVDSVSWNDARKFCRDLSQYITEEVRLPTEAEWEYGCRSGSQGSFCFGDSFYQLEEHGWYAVNSEQMTHPVGQKAPNNWGFYDFYGNVWEWCEDVAHANYENAPSDGSAWLEGGDQTRRILRGGCWRVNQEFCRSSARYAGNADNWYNIYGFRIVIPL